MDIVAIGILLPFLGTALGAACVFFVRDALHQGVQRLLTGFAAGVMVAASFWSLLIPALDNAAHMGKLAFLPVAIGFACGMAGLMFLDSHVPHLHLGTEDKPEGPQSHLSKAAMLVLAVTLHNIPEGMAVGVVYASYLAGQIDITMSAALALSVGIAIQNFPEGAIISLPLRGAGTSRAKAFLGGVGSGVVEPIGAVITIILAELIIPALPFLLAFAAGAMMYVVVEELVPEMSEGVHSHLGPAAFGAGFIVMMILDTTLG